MTAPDIAEQLEQAQREARRLRTDLDRAEGELAQAIEAKNYLKADELTQLAAELRPHVLLAEAQVTAHRNVTQALAEHRRQEQAEAVEKQRQEQARASQQQTIQEEQAAIAESTQLLSEALAMLVSGRKLLRAAQAAEQRAGNARVMGEQIAVDAGWREQAMWGAGLPNAVEAAITDRPILGDLLRDLSL